MIFALPRIDFSKGIPPEFRTLTVVPTMLISPENIDHLIEALEVRFLANRDDSRRAWEMLAMINPVNHAKSPDGIATYKVEPYVVAADVYALLPHTARS
jgi:hypothetical protein